MKTLLVAGLAAFLGTRSDPTGVYVMVEKVVYEPDNKAPERVQVWGAFSVAKGKFGDDYEPAVRGYMYFSYDPSKDANKLSLAEWKDLQSAAGKADGLGFGSRYTGTKRVRPESEPVKNPDPYILGMGARKAEFQAESLKRIPALASPAADAQVEPGRVTLRVRNALDPDGKNYRYFFKISAAGGGEEASEAVGAGEKETFWTPKMEVKPKIKYTWSAWTVKDAKMGPVATGTFVGKG